MDLGKEKDSNGLSGLVFEESDTCGPVANLSQPLLSPLLDSQIAGDESNAKDSRATDNHCTETKYMEEVLFLGPLKPNRFNENGVKENIAHKTNSNQCPKGTNDPHTKRWGLPPWENSSIQIFLKNWRWILLVAGGVYLYLKWDSPGRQNTPEQKAPEVFAHIKAPEKKCRQIGTEGACRQKTNCRWIRRLHCCVDDYIASYQFREDITDRPKGNSSDLKPGYPIRVDGGESWCKTAYSEYLLNYAKPLGRLNDPIRLEIFCRNWKEVFEHNESYRQGLKTWSKAINLFTDMTEEELKTYTGYTGESHRDLNSSTWITSLESVPHIPKSLDYREKGVVTPVKDQGGCGSCFAFATVAAMESKHAVLTGKIIDLSEQHVVDCSKSYGNNGCNGGNFNSTFNFLRYASVDTEANIPYKQTEGSACFQNKNAYNLMEWKRIEKNEADIKEAMMLNGPVVASLVVDKEFFSYEGGVFTTPNDTVANHAVLVVGYGQENGTDVWYIKNSWGENWGEGGFMSIHRNANLRGISEEVYAIVGIKNTAPSSKAAFGSGICVLYLVVIIYVVVASSL